MATIITRAAKGAPLTHNEVDANFTNLNTDKIEASDLTAGAGISISGTTITNAAPDQTVVLTEGANVTITGTYPNFTIASTDTNTTYTAGSGLQLVGTEFSNTAPDQTVTITGSGIVSVSGTYPNFEVAATALQASDIGVSVQAYDANLTSFVSAFTLPTADGTSGQALATNGTGTLSFVDVGGGGAWELISTSTPSSASSVTITLPTGYNALMLNFGEIYFNTAGINIYAYFNASHEYRYSFVEFKDSSNDQNDTGDTNGIKLFTNNQGQAFGTAWVTSGRIIISQGYDNASVNTSVFSCIYGVGNTYNMNGYIGMGMSETAAADGSITISPSSGNMSGTIALYGLKSS